MADVSIDIELVTAAFNKALKESGQQIDRFTVNVNKSQKNVQGSFDKIGRSAKNTKQSFDVLAASASVFLGNLALNAVTSFAEGLVNLGQSAVDSAIRFEQLNTQFEVLTGSAQVAQDTLAELQEFSARTPFRFEEIASTAAQLISFGVEAENVTERLQRIGDVAAATNQPIGRIGLIFGQISAAGKLTGERLLQLREAAVPIGPALAETLGVAETAISDLVSQGAVDFETFQRAFDSLSDAGGPAFEGLIKQSQTLGGLLSTLGDNFQILATDIGNQALPFLKELGITLLNLIQTNKDFLVSLGIDIIQAFVSAIATTIRAINFFRDATTGLTVILEGFAALAGRVATGLLELARVAVVGAQALAELTGVGPSENLDRINQSLNGLIDTTRSFTQAQIESSESRLEARDKERANFEAFAVALENAGNKEVSIIQDTNNRKDQLAAEQAAKEIQAERDKQAAIDAVRQEFGAQREVIEIEAQIAEAEENELALGSIRDLEEQKLTIIRDAELEKAATIKDVNERAAAEETARQKFALGQLKADVAQRKVIREQEKKQRDEDAKQERQVQRLRLQATQGFLSAGLSLAKNGSKEQKALQAATAFTSTFAAANQALASPPGPPFTLPLVAATIASGLANVAKINSAGSFQDGGIVPGSSFTGDRLTANVNSGELILNRGQQQRLLNIANGQEGGGSVSLRTEDIRTIVESTVSNLQVTLEADDVEIARSVSRGVDNGVVIASS